jgi:hypothetical protein
MRRASIAMLVVGACQGDDRSAPAPAPPPAPAVPDAARTMPPDDAPAATQEPVMPSRIPDGPPGGDLEAELERARRPRPPPGRVTVVAHAALDHTSLDADTVLAVLQADHLQEIRTCYQGARVPDVELVLVIGVRGRVVDTQITGAGFDVKHCLGDMTPTWMFPVAKDDAGQPTSARFAITLRQVADLKQQIDEATRPADMPRIGPIHPGDDNARRQPAGNVVIDGTSALDDTTLTGEVVTAKIRSAYLAGIKRCYTQLLTRNAGAAGAANLSFTVDEHGRAVRPIVASFDKSLAACVQGLTSSWRFAIPKDQDGEATDASFRVKLAFAQI